MVLAWRVGERQIDATPGGCGVNEVSPHTSNTASDPFCGWSGTMRRFVDTDQLTWLQSLQAHRTTVVRVADEPQQTDAWIGSFHIVHDQIAVLLDRRPASASWTLAFEFEIPREGGRRVDLVVLANAAVIVVEFKRARHARQEHIDQVAAYARDLRSYHLGCRDRTVIPLLVPTSSEEASSFINGVTIVAPRNLARAVTYFAEKTEGNPIDAAAWLRAEYEPLPTLVEAARRIFRDEPLPEIRRAASAQIPATVQRLHAVVTVARERKQRHLCILTGVPGSGKTLVGLQLVHTRIGANPAERGLYLSRNVPLIKVLQHYLKNSVFVQNVYGFHRRYNDETGYLPGEHLLVYDEAQRALDAKTVTAKRQHAISEPEELIHLADRMRDWAVIVALIGEGQEIHYGEEGGLDLWNAAISRSPNRWFVHSALWTSRPFTAAARVFTSDRLDLTTSLRSHLAGDITKWVDQTLAGTFLAAKVTAARLQAQGFTMYLSRDWDGIQEYVRQRYAGQPGKRYGILSSSKAKAIRGSTFRLNAASSSVEQVLEHIAQNDEFEARKQFDVVAWLTDPPDSPKSCCQLRDGAKEFDIQGLELDMPIISWGSDMFWRSDGWSSNWEDYRALDYDRLRHNTYRVLLTRGRDGFVIWVPERLKATYRALVHCGVQELEPSPES